MLGIGDFGARQRDSEVGFRQLPGRTLRGGRDRVDDAALGGSHHGLVPNGSTATATARVFSGTGFLWRVTVKAICANTPVGLQYVSLTSTTPVSPGSPVVGAKPICPSTKRLIGFGGTVSGGRIMSFMPQNRPATGVWLSGRPFPGTSGTLTVRAMAVCANAGFVSSFDEPPLATSQGQPVTSTASCPAGMYVHAAAGWAATDPAYISEVAVDSTKTTASLTLRSSASSSFSGKVVPFCVG
ncbi:hypothetical protein [Catelliglobosispora koreensis]|uniref:hypothetical protein n=1 Tax=Catelliglobosispora koreensis TaxID=129052 RepID=UPI000377DCBD|nr:hypothetical protein [Catelliglobosispora koreensis]